jgi:FkbM family methyltransferase
VGKFTVIFDYMKAEMLMALLAEQEKKLAAYGAISGPGLWLKYKRVCLLGYKYILFEVSHRLHLKSNAHVALFWNKKITLPLHDVDVKYLYYFGVLGRAEIPLTKFLIKNLNERSVFYDIGANYGFFSLLASELVPSRSIHIFEPQSALFSYLAANFNASVVRNIEALSNHVGEINFYSGFAGGASGISTTKQSVVNARSDSFKETIIPCTTLDTYVSTHTPPTLIKLDVEGAEFEVLEGAVAVLEEYSPVIAMEVWFGRGNEHSAKAVDFLLSLGYRQYRITDKGELVEYCEADTDPSLFAHVSYANFIFKK